MPLLISTADSAESISRCFSVMAELRLHLTREGFLAQVLRQQLRGYQLTFAEADGLVRGVAGYHLSECLAWGRILYVEDLVTSAADQGRGFGRALFEWLLAFAQREGCQELHLDSGVQRFGAHRFYLGQGMDITSHHFALRLQPDAT